MTTEDLKSAVDSARAEADWIDDVAPIPAWLMPIAEQAADKYGLEGLDLVKKAALAGIDALAQKIHVKTS